MKEMSQQGSDPANELRVAAYIRVSTLKAEQEDSYELQERYFTKLLDENPTWKSAGVYSDYALSATSTKRRTGFNRLLRHCREGRIDRIISKSISRFARNTSDFLMAIRTLDENGVTIFFEKENIDTADGTSEFIIATLGALAQEESRTISENIRWGFQKRSSLGEARNIDIYGYRFAVDGSFSVTESGYRFRNIEIVEEEAQVVRRIFSEVADGNTYIGIARGLNRDNIQAPGGAEAGWTGERVRRMVDLERYVGDMLLQKGFVADFLTHKERKNTGELPMYYVKGHHEPIISRELFERTQETVNARRKSCTRNVSRRYPLSGLLVCGHCGHHFQTYNRKSHPIWVCATVRLRNGKCACNMPSIYEEQVINVFKEAMEMRFDLGTDGMGTICEMRHEMETVHEGDMAEQEHAKLRKEFLRLEAEADTCKMQAQMRIMDHKEAYWEKLEEEYQVRDETLKWLKTLPEGPEAKAEIFRGVRTEYIRGFILEIIVYSSAKYKVVWFDESETYVEVSLNE